MTDEEGDDMADEAPTGGDAAAAAVWLADSKVNIPLPIEEVFFKDFFPRPDLAQAGI